MNKNLTYKYTIRNGVSGYQFSYRIKLILVYM